MKPYAGPPATVADVIARIQRPARAVVTAGMPYANGPLHLGHIAGAQLPADIHARWLKLLIGADNVLYVCGTDEHGSATELAALQQGRPVREVLDEVHDAQGATMARYEIGLDVYSGTSRPEAFERHKQRCQEMLRQLYDNGLLKKKTSMQWFDPKLSRFLADRMVRGKCPNPSCDNLDAYSDECGVCGNQHEPTDLVEPRSALSDATPEMRETAHLYLDMWATSDLVLGWLETKKKSWRKVALAEVIETLRPAVSIEKGDEERLKALKDELPPHKRKYTAGKRVQVQADNKHDLEQVRAVLTRAGIPHQLEDGWAHRSISRDIEWGVPLPALDADLKGKTFYVWPDSLIAPIAFTEVALERAGHDPADYRAWWCDPDARIYQFLGQDNVFFYVLMQAALWIGSQKDPTRLPARGELQLNEVFACFHLLVNGKKMSKSVGNFFTGEQLLERGYSSDQLRYYLALLDLGEKPSDFDFAMLDERNAFLSGKMNAVFERPISAALSKFG
ncbi:MAG: methionine--tRNA ligase, partial [Myxococcota bacterium]